ncbi:MAG: YceI family protein [Bacteroidia bacterium]
MKTIKLTIFAAAAVALSVFAWRAMAQPWVADIEKAVITFDLPDGGASGSVKGLDAAINFDPSNLSESSITASVDVKTLTTGIDMRDKHLMADDYFDAEKHPKITFTATSILPGDNGFIANGKLSMRDSVHAVSIPFTFTENGDSGMFKGSFSVFAGDYGVGKKSKGGKDKVVVTLEVPATRKK